ncbi:cupredoxin family copper-binding protein [Kitasatospora sp. NPDC004745]|uniref:cupredoxin domain-containing protein n=1 Tax=unclassified Kitasatospora TaxID=2633591 RepID=UPI0033F531BA
MTVPRLSRAAGTLLLAGVLAACSSSSTKPAQPTTAAASPSAATGSPSAGTPSPATTAASPSAAATSPSASPSQANGVTHVAIRNFQFEPAALTLAPGTTFTVTNQDSTAHTLTADDKSFDSGTIAPGATATLTAPQQSGAHPYICTIHPFMHGTLTVS